MHFESSGHFNRFICFMIVTSTVVGCRGDSEDEAIRRSEIAGVSLVIDRNQRLIEVWVSEKADAQDKRVEAALAAALEDMGDCDVFVGPTASRDQNLNIRSYRVKARGDRLALISTDSGVEQVSAQRDRGSDFAYFAAQRVAYDINNIATFYWPNVSQ